MDKIGQEILHKIVLYIEYFKLVNCRRTLNDLVTKQKRLFIETNVRHCQADISQFFHFSNN